MKLDKIKKILLFIQKIDKMMNSRLQEVRERTLDTTTFKILVIFINYWSLG